MDVYDKWYNRFHEKIKNNQPLLGTWITISHPEVVEILSNLQFDWFLFDMEHAPLTISDIEKMLMALKGSDVVPLVRVPWNDPVEIKRALDLGVAGIIVPWVNNKDEAMKAVRAIRYPPHGIRGVGPRRCIMYGFWNAVEYFNNWNKRAILIAQIETKSGYENLEEIIEVDGVSGIFVGPADLSASLGLFGKTQSPEFLNILQDIARRASKYNKIVGIMAETPEFAQKALEMGYNFISLSHDMKYLIEGAKLYLNRINNN
ncbi:MAG: HpcH/HpaI aldolase/citrate lyase family protein [Staphylothermus sp.]|nr:HpcH/HpaI aldolase/citrate lyase family protein [Staphylothermus sp.]